jgi:membrane-bound lytic murein transglycosylase A
MHGRIADRSEDSFESAARTVPTRGLARARVSVALAIAGGLTCATAVLLGGCKAEPEPAAKPDTTVMIPEGEHGLRKLGANDPKPDLKAAYATRDAKLTRAVDQSSRWFTTGTSIQRYETPSPLNEVATHQQAAASVEAFRQLLASSTSADAFQEAVYEQFDIWQSRGYDGQGTVFFTGYFSPELNASPVRTERFAYPLFKCPPDLVRDSFTGEPLGRRLADGTIDQWPTRKELIEGNAFAGTELVWLESPLDVYVAEVNGSAKLIYPDNSVKYIGYAGKTGREYKGLGKSLVEAGVISKDQLSLSAIKRLYQNDPATVQKYMDENQNMVFFMHYDGKTWPSGSIGVPVTDRATMATDKKIFPAGLVMLVDTKSPTYAGEMESFNRFMVDQDTGGAIRAAGRGDIYMGVGAAAEILAGGQVAEGTFYYFTLKPEYISKYPLPTRTKSGMAAATETQQ